MDTVIYSEVSKISIKKILIIIMTATVFVSIILFSLVSNGYVNNYFDEYIESVYDTNVNYIVDFSKFVLIDGKQQRSILNSYVTEPIYYAEIYDMNDNLIMYSGGQSSKFIIDDDTMSTEYIDIIHNDVVIGSVLIVRAKEISYTSTKQVFVNALYLGALIAALLVFIIIGFISAIIIRYISGNTKKVVGYANHEDIQKPLTKITEFSSINDAISGYRQKLAIKDKIKKEKFDRILHETKTPITVLKSQLEGVVDGIIDIDSIRAQDMVIQVDKLDTTLKDATDIIEGNEITEDIKITQIDYSNRLEKIVTSMQTRFNKKGLELLYNIKPFVISTDKNLLDNIIYNLLMNSYKYTDKGCVTIETDNKELTITDTGIGIVKDELDKVFNPYFRGGNINDTKGEGLGLYNVKKNLEKLNIDINVTSKLNEFTQFKLIFK